LITILAYTYSTVTLAVCNVHNATKHVQKYYLFLKKFCKKISTMTSRRKVGTL
jgi:hypothetical protein